MLSSLCRDRYSRLQSQFQSTVASLPGGKSLTFITNIPILCDVLRAIASLGAMTTCLERREGGSDGEVFPAEGPSKSHTEWNGIFNFPLGEDCYMMFSSNIRYTGIGKSTNPRFRENEVKKLCSFSPHFTEPGVCGFADPCTGHRNNTCTMVW